MGGGRWLWHALAQRDELGVADILLHRLRHPDIASHEATVQVLVMSGQFDTDIQGSRSTRVVISVVTVVMSL